MPLTPYEWRMSNDPGWAMNEGGLFFEGQSAVNRALHRITKRLEELAISYAVVGGMALFQHGVRRFTEVVDILVTQEGLARIHTALAGLGYVPPFAGSKNLRDAELGVKVEFIVCGQFPGDGKPKPVAFPDPADVAEVHQGIRFINLATLVQLKLASGMTNLDRMKDLTDVYELIKQTNLSRDLANQLDPYVRDKYLELWETAAKFGREES